jgi:hypothetical protein
LGRRGLTLLRAKRAAEEMIQNGRTVVEVPTIERRQQFVAELAEAGRFPNTEAQEDPEKSIERSSR